MAKETSDDLNIDEAYDIFKRIEATEKEVSCLRQRLMQKEQELLRLNRQFKEHSEELTKIDIERYCRQIILPGIGIKGQRNIKESSVLIVGAGGIGCPVSLYLAAAGVGRLGLVDYDEVEISNLHRQVLHSEVTVGVSKVASAAENIKRLNMNITVEKHNTLLTASNIMGILKSYDVVVDATDNVPTRYLLNDACYLSGKKPLVSGSALQMEGQLTVYGGVRGNKEGGDISHPPCYRCLFPTPPPVETISSCQENGVLGVVPGIIGVLQALEVIKILIGRNVNDGKLGPCFSNDSSLSGKLVLFDASSCAFRSVKLRNSDPKCALCGQKPTITSLNGMDYEMLCGVRVHENPTVNLLSEEDRITALEYAELLEKKMDHVLVDVRSRAEFEMCHLPSAINLPMDELSKASEVIKKAVFSSKISDSGTLPVYVLCRRGNDSQTAVINFRKQLGEEWIVRDIEGGLHSWSENIDLSFPHY